MSKARDWNNAEEFTSLEAAQLFAEALLAALDKETPDADAE